VQFAIKYKTKNDAAVSHALYIKKRKSMRLFVLNGGSVRYGTILNCTVTVQYSENRLYFKTLVSTLRAFRPNWSTRKAAVSSVDRLKCLINFEKSYWVNQYWCRQYYRVSCLTVHYGVSPNPTLNKCNALKSEETLWTWDKVILKRCNHFTGHFFKNPIKQFSCVFLAVPKRQNAEYGIFCGIPQYFLDTKRRNFFVELKMRNSAHC